MEPIGDLLRGLILREVVEEGHEVDYIAALLATVFRVAGNHGTLARHAVMRDLVSDNSRKYKNAKNVMISMHVDPIWICHPGNLPILRSHNSIKSGRNVSTAMKAQAFPNNATRSVAGV